MKRRLSLLVILGCQCAVAQQWALRNVASGEYLYAKGEQAALAKEFSLIDKSFSWIMEPQPDGTLFLKNEAQGYLVSDKNGSISTSPEGWTAVTTTNYLYRTFKSRSGGILKAGGSDLWRVEPVPEPVDLKGRGARITWSEYQAENGDFQGKLAGPSTELTDAASEAVGRMAVKLEKTGDNVSWVATADADGMEVRYCIPDAPKGGGIDATLSLCINGQKVESLPLTSTHAWVYGEGHSSSRFWTDDPANGTPRKHYDSTRFKLMQMVHKGDRVELHKDASDAADFYIIDMIELEKIPVPRTQPAGYLSIAEFGAVPDDGRDDSAALKAALAAAASKKAPGVWVPAGVFDFLPDKPLPADEQGNPDQKMFQRFALSEIHLQGAGPWHSELRGSGIAFSCSGNRINVSDLAIDWEGKSRRAAILFFGKVGQDSGFSNLYVTHCGLLMSINDASSRNFTVRDCRLRSFFAGGINLRGGHRNALIENVHARGIGDDGLIFWSTENGENGEATRDCTIRNCTVEVPWNGNCFLMAGGEGSLVKDCVGVDGVRHSGVRITTQIYGSATMPFTGTNRVEGVTLIRCGSDKLGEYNGAIQMEAHGYPVGLIEITDCDILSSPYAAIQIYDKINDKGRGGLDVDSILTGCTLAGAALSGVYIGPDTPGTTEIKNTKFSGCMLGNVHNDSKQMKLTVTP